MSRGRLIGGIIGLALLMGVVLFVVQVVQSYGRIQRGEADPFLEKKLQSSFSKLVANQKVTQQDIARLKTPDAPTFGNPKAKLTIVEFLDFDCPFCGATFGPLREVMEKYSDRIQVVIRDFPIEEIHPRAFPAALAARCAHAQGKFWPYHDQLFFYQARHEDVDFVRYAQMVGLNEKAFRACYEKQTYKEQVLQGLGDGLQVGVQGTPTFFFNDVKIQGALNREQLEFLIQRFLKL
ncbi:MAG: thioredoxin domain-containing protein [Candidatus Uhrbacteria bacterium]|nr:thioredoxin domain-containing protein [Candidatus Uhrbacteria bacterium]